MALGSDSARIACEPEPTLNATSIRQNAWRSRPLSKLLADRWFLLANNAICPVRPYTSYAHPLNFLKTMPARKDITIRFCFTKSDGDPVELSQFSAAEKADLRKCLSLNLTYCPTEGPSAKIISIEILYDGITPVEDEEEGFYLDPENDEPLDGEPAPIVRFHLDRAMDEEEFRQSIFETSYAVCTKSMKENDQEPFFVEDQNGYTSVLSKKERDQWIMILQCNKAHCGKQFNFPDGLPEAGYSIPAMEFALKPAKLS